MGVVYSDKWEKFTIAEVMRQGMLLAEDSASFPGIKGHNFNNVQR